MMVVNLRISILLIVLGVILIFCVERRLQSSAGTARLNSEASAMPARSTRSGDGNRLTQQMIEVESEITSRVKIYLELPAEKKSQYSPLCETPLEFDFGGATYSLSLERATVEGGSVDFAPDVHQVTAMGAALLEGTIPGDALMPDINISERVPTLAGHFVKVENTFESHPVI